MVGVLLLLVAAGCQPHLHHFGHSFVGKRLVAVTAAAGVLLVLLRPPMPVKVRFLQRGWQCGTRARSLLPNGKPCDPMATPAVV